MKHLLLAAAFAVLAGCQGFVATGLDLGANAGRTFGEGESSSSNYVGVKANVHFDRKGGKP